VSIVVWLTVLIIWSVVSGVSLILSLLLTNPVVIGPLGVTAWFVVLFFSLGALLTLALYAAKTFLHLHVAGFGRLRYAWRQGLLLSGWVTGMLALSSLRQLSWLDAILLALLLLIVEVYVRFRWP
jgi:hypothetical protein